MPTAVGLPPILPQINFPARGSSLSPIRIPLPDTPDIHNEDDVVPEESERSISWSSTSSPTRKFPPRKSSLSPIDSGGGDFAGLNGLLAIVSSTGEERVVEIPIGVGLESRTEHRGRRPRTQSSVEHGIKPGGTLERNQPRPQVLADAFERREETGFTAESRDTKGPEPENLDDPTCSTVEESESKTSPITSKRNRLTVDDSLGLEAQAMFAEAMAGMFMNFDPNEPETPVAVKEDTKDEAKEVVMAEDSFPQEPGISLRRFSFEEMAVLTSGASGTVSSKYEPRPETPTLPSEPNTRRTRPPNSLTSRMRRRSWLPNGPSASRSPSPKLRVRPENTTDPDQRPLSSFAPNPEARLSLIISPSGPTLQSKPQSLSKQFANKLRRRDLSLTALDSLARDHPPSDAGLPTQIHKSHSSSSIMPSKSTDRISSLMQPDFMNPKSRSARKRDPLYTNFREMEAACGRFLGKSGEQKAAVVKTVLVPFLKKYSTHPSNFGLNSEDVERRLNILFQWYDALLQFVRHRQFSTLSSQSRMHIYDSILEVMERPEWRHFPSPFASNAINPAMTSERPITSSNSEDEFTTVSVQHNIRIWYSQCLRQQMMIVVEKMSAKNLPSLNTFCGKTCAYAFFYCDGMAVNLIKLWGIPYNTLKRVFDESGVTVAANLSTFTNTTTAVLPEPLKEVVFTTLQEAYKRLESPKNWPMGTESCQWNGPWVDRWSGQDSDLFYCFLKHYSLILSQHLPKASKTERLVAAGGLYIQAQMLVNIDKSCRKHFDGLRMPTVPTPPQRTPPLRSLYGMDEKPRTPQGTPTFDDIVDGPEAPNTTLSFNSFASNQNGLVPLNNANRNVAENRLVLLLKEMLATQDNEYPIECREAFGRLFNDLFRAAAKITDARNRIELDVICIYLEEMILIFTRYEQANGTKPAFMDWEFWFGVWKVMAKGNHFSIEIRILSLVYGVWPAIVLDSGRKESLCYGFLLEREYFESRFSHWSPMVRSYFHRLICWRVAKVHEGVDDTHLKILACLQERLKAVYGHYLYIYEKAVANNTELPKTAPALPATNRRFLIIRGDRPSPLLATFENPGQSIGSKRALALEQLCSSESKAGAGEDHIDSLIRPLSTVSTASTDEDIEESPKRWTRGNLLRSIIGTRPVSRSKSQSPSRAGAQMESSTRPPTSHVESHNRNGSINKAGGLSAATDDTVTAWRRQQSSSRSYYFKFSMETVERRTHPHPITQLFVPRLPLPAQSLLQRHLRGLALTTTSSVPTTPESLTAPPHSLNEPPVPNEASTSDATNQESDSQPLLPQMPAKQSTAKVARETSPYCGRALAEWAGLVHECHMFFERRKSEGVPSNRFVETPLLPADAAGRPNGERVPKGM